MEVNIRVYWDVLITSTGDVIKMLVGDFPWQCGDVPRTLHWGVLRTSYFNVLRTLEDVLRTSIGDVIPRRITDGDFPDGLFPEEHLRDRNFPDQTHRRWTLLRPGISPTDTSSTRHIPD